MTIFSTDEQSKRKRLKLQRAHQLAANGEWEEAVRLNREILEASPQDVAALNRLGKALSELRRYGEAYASYRQAVELDPVNQIAKRNLQRLEPLKDQAEEESAAERRRNQARQSMFIEEIGKTRLTELHDPAPNTTLARMTSGDQVELRVEGKQIVVYSEDGLRLGHLEPRLARRLVALIEGGNRYGAAVTAVEPGMIRVIVRELFQHPSQLGRLSFPVDAKPLAPRPYLRDSARLYGDDQDFIGDEDSDDEELDAEAEEDDEFTEETSADEPEEEQQI